MPTLPRKTLKMDSPLTLVAVIIITSLIIVWAMNQKSQSVLSQDHSNNHVSDVHGIDVSNYQGDIRWDHVKKTGVAFAYVKATGGMTYQDPMFKENWHGIRTTGIYRGAYHFFFALDDPEAQANNFLLTMGPLQSQDLPPVLDLEITDHADQDRLQLAALAWLRIVEERTGRRPMVYTDPGFADRLLKDPAFSNYPLWIADYGNKIESLPQPWKKSGWKFWQHSQSGQIKGAIDGEVDLDAFHGSLEELSAFIEHSHTTFAKSKDVQTPNDGRTALTQ